MIEIDRVSKSYPLFRKPADRLLNLLPFSAKRYQSFSALNDISLSIGRGETMAIVGPNGSGKSTLLQLVAGVVAPTTGVVRRNGKVAALLELGAGFNPEFTGRENAFLYGELQGLTRQEISGTFSSISAFAEIGDFIDRPVKEYSSGMYIRLAFSVAIHVSPDILLIDEALAVGDVKFANRCIRKLEQLRQAGTTILFVSHDLGLVKRLADRAALLVAGQLDSLGDSSTVVNRYVGLALAGSVNEEEATPSVIRHGDGNCRIDSVSILDESGNSRKIFNPGETIVIEVTTMFLSDCESPVFGLLIRNRLGMDVYGTNNRVEGLTSPKVRAGTSMRVKFTFPCQLTKQYYSVTVAVQNDDGTSQDWLDDVASFFVAQPKELAGVADLQATIRWDPI